MQWLLKSVVTIGPGTACEMTGWVFSHIRPWDATIQFVEACNIGISIGVVGTILGNGSYVLQHP